MYAPNSWLFSIERPTPIDIECEDVYPLMISGSGILQLKENCMMRNPQMSVIARKTDIVNIPHTSIIPAFDLTWDLVKKPEHYSCYIWLVIGSSVGFLVIVIVGYFLYVHRKKSQQPIYDNPSPTTATRMSQRSV